MVNAFVKIICIIICCFGVFSHVFGEDDSNNDRYRNFFDRALKAKADGSFDEAGDLAIKAEEATSDSVLKANALQEAINCYKAGGMLYKEFNCIEKMIVNYRNYTNVVNQIDRMFAIGDAYFSGEREPSFWSLRWIPWLHDRDKTEEMYVRALAQGPFAKGAHLARMRLATALIESGKSLDALKHLREIVRLESNNLEYRYAYLILGEQLYFLAQKGDGDGLYNQEALEVFEKFKNKYPDASENDMVDKWILKLKDFQAKKLLDMSKFYYKGGKNEAAIRYANEVISKYSDSIYAEDAERLLVKMDKKYIPNSIMPEVKSRLQSYESYKLVDEEQPLLINPSESNKGYLLPVYDLGLDKQR